MAFRTSCKILRSQHLAVPCHAAMPPCPLRLFFLDQLIHYQYRRTLDELFKDSPSTFLAPFFDINLEEGQRLQRERKQERMWR